MDPEETLRRAREAMAAEAAQRGAAEQAAAAEVRERDEARQAYVSYEQDAAVEVVRLLDYVLPRLGGVPPMRYELRADPEPVPLEQPRRTFLRRRMSAPAPVNDAAYEVTGWAYGEGAEARVLTADRRMYRFGDWTTATQSRSLEDWSIEAVQAAARHYQTESSYDSHDGSAPYLISRDRFKSAFALPMRHEEVAAMKRCVDAWVDRQRRFCAALLPAPDDQAMHRL